MQACAELFVQSLEAKNLNFDVNEFPDGTTLVAFPYQGKVTRCIFNGDEGGYLSLYLVYERVPDEKVADVIFLCNELNCEYKWATFYVDKDNDIVIHDDAILVPENAAEEAFELLVRIVRIAEDERQRIMKTIYS